MRACSFASGGSRNSVGSPRCTRSVNRIVKTPMTVTTIMSNRRIV